MLVKFGHAHGPMEEGPGGPRYETMQCFALTQPKAMIEEGEGTSAGSLLQFRSKWVHLTCIACEMRDCLTSHRTAQLEKKIAKMAELVDFTAALFMCTVQVTITK